MLIFAAEFSQKRKMKYKTAIFDLDGTLLDTIGDLSEAVNHALALRGLPLHSVSEYRLMVGHGVRNLVTRALPEEMQGDEALIDSALKDFKEYYTAHIDVFTRPYPGMRELLETLKDAGVHLAVASNKFQSGTEHLVREFFPSCSFVSILGNREGFPLKPDPAIVEEILRSSGDSPAEAVMVGDSGSDMKTAANGGIAAIAVTWGYRTLPESDAYSLATTPAALLGLLTR